MIHLFVVAFGLGMVFNATPGVIFAESLRRGLRGGFHRALAVQLGSVIGDSLWAVLGLAGVGALFLLDDVRVPLTLAGAALTVLLGLHSVRQATVPALALRYDSPALPAQVRPASDFGVGAALSLTSPTNVAFWGGGAAAVSSAVGVAPSPGALGVFFSGFFVASILWCWVSAAVIALIRRSASTRVVRVIDGSCGLALVALGGWSLAALP